MTRELTKDEVLDELATFLGETMLELTTTFKGLEKEVAYSLANQLGAYISIVSKDPPKALAAIAKRIIETDHNALRAAHFGYTTLGVKAPVASREESVDAPVIHIGEAKGRRE